MHATHLEMEVEVGIGAKALAPVIAHAAKRRVADLTILNIVVCRYIMMV